MIDKLQNLKENDQGFDDGDNNKNNDDDELKMNKGYHIDEMLGFPSLLDKIRNRLEDQDDSFQMGRPRRQSNEELSSPEKKQIQSQFRVENRQTDYNEIRSKQISQVPLIHRRKGGSYDNKTQKGGFISHYKHLETKFILDLNNKDDLHDLYQSINLEKKTEMLTLMIKRSLGQLEMFRDLEQNLKPQNYFNLVRSLKTLIVKQGSTIFSYGSVGKQYYFLIKGSVYILLRTGLGSKINSLEKINTVDKQQLEEEKVKKERKRQVDILRKRDSFEQMVSQSIITTTQKKTKFLQQANKLQSQPSNVIGENEEQNKLKSPLLSQKKSIWEVPAFKKSSFQHQKEASSPGHGLSYLLRIQQTEKREDDLRSQRSLEERITMAWSVDSIRNKEEIKKQFPHFQIVGTHNQGDGFGELSLLKGIKRTATIVAKEDCFFLTLDKDCYLNCLADYHEKIYQEKICFVKQFFIFEQLDKRLPSLIILFEPKTYISGQTIYQPGEETNYLYLIKKGNVSINRKIVQRTEKELIKRVEEQDNVASQYLKEMQQQKMIIQKQNQNRLSQDFDSENTSKQDYFHELTYSFHDPLWDKKQESEENDGDQEDIKNLQYSEEKGAFIGRNQNIFSMMRSSPTKDRFMKANNNSQSPKKNTALTIVGECGFFGEEEIVNGEKLRQFEAKVTSNKVEVLRISIKNLKIISKYNDVMQRIKVYSELKSEWRHNYVERSQNALLIQDYLAKNFKEIYTKNVLNKDNQQKAAVQIMSKTIPDSMNANKQTQSILNRKLYIRKTSKNFKEKSSPHKMSDIINEESSLWQDRKSSSDITNIIPYKFNTNSPDNKDQNESNKLQRNKLSTASPQRMMTGGDFQDGQRNPTADISCKDLEPKVIQLPTYEIFSKNSASKLQKDYAFLNAEQREKDFKPKDSIKPNLYKKSITDSPVFEYQNSNQKNPIKYQQSLMSPLDDTKQDRLNSSQKLIKIIKLQKDIKVVDETLTTNQNENSQEDLIIFSTQQKQFQERKSSTNQTGNICNFLEEADHQQEEDIQESPSRKNVNDNYKIEFNSPCKNNHTEHSAEVRIIIEKQSQKLAQESEQKQKTVEKQIKNYQKEQVVQMQKLRGILMKENDLSNNKKKVQEKDLNKSQDLNFRDIHSIFINIEGIKSNKINKYTKQYKEVKEKYTKEARKKQSFIPNYERVNASEIVLNSKLRSNSQYVNECLPYQNQNTISSAQRQRSNSISQNSHQPQRKFSFREYVEKQKSNSIENSPYHPYTSQFKGDSVVNNQNTSENRYTEQSYISQSAKSYQTQSKGMQQTDHSSKKGQFVNQKQNNTKQDTIQTQSNSINNMSHSYLSGFPSQDNIIEALDKSQDYYFLQKTPTRRISIKQHKGLDKIIEKENSMIFNQDQQDHQSEMLIKEQNRIEEADIDQVRNMLLLVKKLKIDHLIETKYTEQLASSGFMSRSINLQSAPTTARSVSQLQRRKKSSISEKKPQGQVNNLSRTYSQNKNTTAGQDISQMNNTCIHFKDESHGRSSRQIFDMTQKENTQRRKSSGAIFRPHIPIQQFPIKTQQNKEQGSYSLHTKYPNFHHF